MQKFILSTPFEPKGGQKKAISELIDGIQKKHQFQTLLGVTGSGKTFTIANVIEKIQNPTLVIAHNKTLAAQLYLEFKNFFPKNAVRYFVSYYDYYQPEAYLPSRDMYIAKDAQINEELDKLRHATTSALLTRKDVIVVASVSCIYNIGSPKEYAASIVHIKEKDHIKRDDLLKNLVDIHYLRNDFDFLRGTFRVRGDIVDIFPAYEENAVRIELFGDEVEKISIIHPVTNTVISELAEVTVFSATHFIIAEENIKKGISSIKKELKERIEYFLSKNMIVEAKRIEQRTLYDLELIEQLGYCSGIENYSRHFSDRAPGEPPYCLLDYFDDFLLVIDESHMSIPQIKGMYEGDHARKDNLVNFGFRLPSAYDNRPLRFNEFKKYLKRVIFTSATPAEFELKNSSKVVELVIRPTGLLDPKIEVRPIKGQIDDLIAEIKTRVEKKERVLVTTLTKKMAENLTEYLQDAQIKTQYLHSDIETLDRTDILKDLRMGAYDVVVGINLLREGLDLPEVSLVAILDADKEGFLRSERSLIQTMGRAARHKDGTVIMYADTITKSMQNAINETNRRRTIQRDYNRIHNITPTTIKTKIHHMPRESKQIVQDASIQIEEDITFLETQMQSAVVELNFEKAAVIRDRIIQLRGGTYAP